MLNIKYEQNNIIAAIKHSIIAVLQPFMSLHRFFDFVSSLTIGLGVFDLV